MHKNLKIKWGLHSTHTKSPLKPKVLVDKTIWNVFVSEVMVAKMIQKIYIYLQ